MGRRRRIFQSPALFLAAIVAFMAISVQSLTISYCSDENTGSDSDASYSIYQSNGACYDTCQADYAFAIVQGQNCWCSNYIPADQTDTSNCDSACPGYPSDKCGNPSQDLYGYIKLEKAASGTLSVASATSSADSQSSTATSQTSAESTAAATTTTTSDSSTSTWTPTPVTSARTVVVSGNVVTEFITTTPTTPPRVETVRKGPSGGAIAGAVVGGLVGLGLIVAAALWFLFRRRKDGRGAPVDSEAPKISPRRNTSTLSRTGLLRSEKDWNTNSNNNRSSVNGLDAFADDISPVSERRNSRPLFYDQRLNPDALHMDNDNASRESIITVDDARDYTRTLNVRNPDPPEFAQDR